MNYKNLANDLGADQRTMSNYVLALETALLCQKLYNFSSNLLTSEKKNKKALSLEYGLHGSFGASRGLLPFG